LGSLNTNYQNSRVPRQRGTNHSNKGGVTGKTVTKKIDMSWEEERPTTTPEVRGRKRKKWEKINMQAGLERRESGKKSRGRQEVLYDLVTRQ